MEAAEVVSKALLLMRQAGARRWRDLPSEDRSRLGIDGHPALELLRCEKRKTTTIAICDRCGRWMVAYRPLPKKCLLTLRCSGTPQRIEPMSTDPDVTSL